jgi:hypothetical protein
MGKYYSYITYEKLVSKLGNIPDILDSEVEYAMTELGKIGEAFIQERIKTSGTGFSKFRAGRGIGSAGRIRSGRMYESVGYRIEKTNNVFRVAIGFVKGQVQKYFRLQDEGFTNVWKFVGFGKTSGPNAPEGFMFKHWRDVPNARPSHTKGMFALRDARQAVEDSQARVLGRVKTKITKRINQL